MGRPRYLAWNCLRHSRIILTSTIGCRLCESHTNMNGLIDLDHQSYLRLTQRVRSFPKQMVAQSDVIHLLVCASSKDYIATATDSRLKMINFDDPKLRSSDYSTLTGLKMNEFDILLTEQANLRQSKRWSRRNSLGLYLTRVKTGWSVSTLCCLFGAKSRRDVSQRIDRTRKLIARSKWISKFIGSKSVDQNVLIEQKTTAFAKRFFGTDEKTGLMRPVVVVDGKIRSTLKTKTSD